MITPEVGNQRKKPTCGLHVVGQAKEMEDNRDCVIKGQPFHFRLDLRRWTSDFKVAIDVPLEKFQGNFLKRALRFAREKGIPVEGTEDYLKISGYNYQETMSFDEIAAILEEGRPVITGFKIDKSFGRLKGKQIYRYQERKAGVSGENQPEVVHHSVLVIGYGVRDQKPYLVFQNSWGKSFGQDGIGRVDMPTAQHFFTISR